ncbi:MULTISPECIES: YbhB/YbcL family Raf kinase inhibitor-like protein [Acidiplasma]|uniref:Phosphatidylethanolamine-binding protein n=2 Tax=Acidiplasma TaxID=507753 RepID=A0A0Q0RRJ1_9ARCH|nr:MULTISPECIES: YbhB/YbcL family Raf kinase inhibitor-like protein [Acidiplasma]KQB34973.1 hypothetical protein AOG55_08315 [Acidiplasma cupricumulans]KQB35569.1 hypothetical protein AOG54_00380 [Acidiplasma aeolicum]
MKISINAFENGKRIPVRFTCDGDDISPEIHVSGIPEGKHYMIIMNDPDAPVGLFTHWIIYNIPASVNILHEDIDKNSITEDGFYQGKNDFGKTGYGGPCPPKGNGPHRYFFNLYVQDKRIDRDKISVAEAYNTVKNKEKTTYMGVYERL